MSEAADAVGFAVDVACGCAVAAEPDSDDGVAVGGPAVEIPPPPDWSVVVHPMAPNRWIVADPW